MTALEAYKLGVKAKTNGQPESDNPFATDVKEWVYWWDGWMSC